MSTPTPLPWSVAVPPSACLTRRFIEGPSGEHIAKIGHMDFSQGQAVDLANAELIARAVNAHPELLAALTETADQLEDLIEATEGLAGLDQFQKDALANSRVVLRAVARKAIAKAEGRA